MNANTLTPEAKVLRNAILSHQKAGKTIVNKVSESLTNDNGNTICLVAQYEFLSNGSKSQALNTLQRTLKRYTGDSENEFTPVKLKLSDRKTGEYALIGNKSKEKEIDTIAEIQKLIEKATDLSDKQVQAIGKGLTQAIKVA